MMTPIKKYNCLIVDDEPPARDVLRRYIAQVPMLNILGDCSNALQAVTAISQQQVDLLFLDIQMPQITGLDLIDTLVKPPKIILTTAFEQYAVKAFERDVTDYLVKPFGFDRFLKAVMKALAEKDYQQENKTETSIQGNAFLYFRADRKMVKVMLDDILFVESLKDYVKINTAKDTIITKSAISSLEAMLPGASFIRVHRSFLVALDKIEAYNQDEIHIANQVVPIGKMYRMAVLKNLTTTG